MLKKIRLNILLSIALVVTNNSLYASGENKVTPLSTLYQYHVIDSSTKEDISVSQLAKNFKNTDVIFMGEFHSHQGAHKLQLDLLQALYHQNKNIILSMEQFSRDAQPIVDGYLAGKYGEATLIDDGNAWKHYKGSYRATVEFAKEHNIPVIAANAPAMFVRCVGKKGVEVLDTVAAEQQHWSARNLDLDNDVYKEKFMSFLKNSGSRHGQTEEVAKKRMMKTFAAQLLRDTTMAESIIDAMKKYPEHQVIHLNGSFHSDGHLGTASVLEMKQPKWVTSVMSPVMVADANNPSVSEDEYAQGDYIYLIKALPDRYIDEEKQNASIRKLIKDRMGKKCEL